MSLLSPPAGFGLQAIEDGVLEVTLRPATGPDRVLQHEQKKGIQQNIGTLAQLLDLDWPALEAASPTHLMIRASLKDKDREWHNEWPIWTVPADANPSSGPPQTDMPVRGSIIARRPQ